MLQPATDPPPATGPRVSITPILRIGSLKLFNGAALPTLLDCRNAILTTSGRAALALALGELRIAAGDEVLIPAYHCLALSAPIRACKAVPVSYRMNRDLSIDIEDMKARIGARTRCIVVVHFFGFPQPLEEVRGCCDRTGLAMIEDCAHAFYSPRQSPALGRCGDFSIGSLMKFFPIFDGGCLVSFRRPLPTPGLDSKGFVFQLKALVHILEHSARWSDSRLFRRLIAAAARGGALLKSANPKLTHQLAEASPGAVFGSIDFEEQWVHARPSAISRAIVRFSNHGRAIRRRRAYYEKYLSELTSIGGGQPFRSDLPQGVVPYVFPFLLSDPAMSFPALRAAGVPMYRWEDVDESTCATTRLYKTRLVQFPCHQELKESEVGHVIDTIRRVLGEQCDRMVGAADAEACR